MDFSKTTNKLPSNIKAVNKQKNLYEKHSIEKAGYMEIDKIGFEQTGNFTVWKHELTSETLIFIEQKSGFYQFGGYVREK